MQMQEKKQQGYALERALIFLRLRLSLRDLFFFHFSLILGGDQQEQWRRRQRAGLT